MAKYLVIVDLFWLTNDLLSEKGVTVCQADSSSWATDVLEPNSLKSATGHLMTKQWSLENFNVIRGYQHDIVWYSNNTTETACVFV